MRRLLFLGLDCASPKILYEKHGTEFNYLSDIINNSERYILKSCHPPITIPAWLVMFTGKSAGELGIYGFRHRKPGDVNESYIINSRHVKTLTLWEELSRKGFRVGVVGFPPSYPPKLINGFMITDFITPSNEKQYTFPPWLKIELERKFGKYIFDVTYRSENKEQVANDLFKMLKQHLEVVKYLIMNKSWDYFFYIEIAVDRVHHAFWKYFDKSHPRYEYHEKYSEVIPKFYKLIDNWVGEIIERLPRDVILVIASDHGVKPMKGAFVINQWLEEMGYLKFKRRPRRRCEELSREIVDWNKTIAWGWGGYYSRIFINLKEREPNGIVEKTEYEDIINQLKRDIGRIRGPNNEKWVNIAYKPVEVYPEVNGDPPDLMVYLDNLSWRSAGTIGWDTLYLPENDRGPDDAVHDWNGVFLVYDREGTLNKGFKGEIKIEEVKGKLHQLIYQ